MRCTALLLLWKKVAFWVLCAVIMECICPNVLSDTQAAPCICLRWACRACWDEFLHKRELAPKLATEKATQCLLRSSWNRTLTHNLFTKKKCMQECVKTEKRNGAVIGHCSRRAGLPVFCPGVRVTFFVEFIHEFFRWTPVFPPNGTYFEENWSRNGKKLVVKFCGVRISPP